MIYYDEQSWWNLVIRFHGTAWESTWHLVLLVFILCLLMYMLEVRLELTMCTSGHTIFGATLSYLLVFRANNASDRYWTGRGSLTHMFVALREMVMAMCIIMRGGAAHEMWRRERASRSERVKIEDAWDIRASMARVNFVRWVLAFSVSLKLHCRIVYPLLTQNFITSANKIVLDWDRIRLRGLMSRQEFEEINDLIPIVEEEHVTRGTQSLTPNFVDGVMEGAYVEEGRLFELDQTPDMRPPLAILFKLWMEVGRHMDEPWGFKGRFAKDHLFLCHSISILYENILTVITTPIPFPYVHLCKMLLVAFVVMTPLLVSPDYGLFVNVILPTGVAMSFLGIDAISAELENPFGDDANDLDIMRAISVLEADCMKLLELSGDFRAQGSFTPYGIPKDQQGDGPQAVRSFLCLTTQLQKETGMLGVQFESMAQEKNTKGAPKLKKAKSNLAQRMSSLTPTQQGIVESDEDDDIVAQTRPLLSEAGTKTDFVPMQEFGADTIVLEDTKKGKNQKEDQILDIVGLDSDDEMDSEDAEGADDDRSAIRSSVHENPSLHMSGLFPGAKTSGRLQQKTDSGRQKLSGEISRMDPAISGSSGASDGFFKPIVEFGTEEVVLAEKGEDDDINDDPIYSDDDPRARQASRSRPAKKTKPAKKSSADDESDEDFGGFQKMSFDSSSIEINLEDEIAEDIDVDLNMSEDLGDDDAGSKPKPKPKSTGTERPDVILDEDSGSDYDDEGSDAGFIRMRIDGTESVVLPEADEED